MQRKNIINAMVTILFLILISLFAIDGAIATWQGPTEVVSGNWGKAPGQFGIEYGDSGDNFPKSIGITSTGKIVVADPINEVLHTFNHAGNFMRDIKRPTPWEGWPYSVIVNGDCAVVGYVEYTHTFNVTTGELVGIANNMGGTDYVSSDCRSIYVGEQTWKSYSPAGQLIKTSTTRPLELGVVTARPISESQYKLTIKYPDKTYELTTGGTFMRYVRDLKGYVYGVNDDSLWKFDQCGKQVGELLMPENQTEAVTSKTGKSLAIPVTYGQPVIAPNGDVYTWEKTAFKYSIVKWTWVDDPNVPTGPDAPSGLTVTPSINGLYLTWTASPQDPGCVTGYEVVRATSSGGVFSTVATVGTGVIKYNDATASAGTTYYYKIRAKAGSEYSPYTAEVSGKR